MVVVHQPIQDGVGQDVECFVADWIVASIPLQATRTPPFDWVFIAAVRA